MFTLLLLNSGSLMLQPQWYCPDSVFHLFIATSKSEYVIYKLKEMGKIGEKDIMQICDQFNKLDSYNSGKITLPDLLENRL